MITFFFWLSAIFILYTYFGYPLLIRAKARHTSQKAPLLTDVNQTLDREEKAWPTIALIVPVHNEAHHIPPKLENLRALDYPKDKISIHFVSDGSEDGSNELLQAEQDVNLIAYHPRAGKPTALNTAVQQQTAPILIMTDARQMIAPDSIKRLVNRLQQPGIGAVSGELCFTTPEDAPPQDADSEETSCAKAQNITAQNVGLYWQYEKAIRDWEGQVHSVAGVTGALYAIHRADYVPLYSDALLDDFEVPIKILKTGKRVVFESGAYVYDKAQSDAATEKTRKIRTLTGNFQSFQHNPWLFTRQNPILWQFLSHKVFRLLVPYAMVIALLCNAFMLGADHSSFYTMTFLIQALFYGLGIGALCSPALQKAKIPNLAAVFLRLNWAAVLGFYHYKKKNITVRWEKTS